MADLHNQSPAQTGFDLSEQALPWQDLIASVFRHRRLVLTVLAVGVIAATLRGWFLPPTYKASALVMVRDNRARLTVSPDESSGAVLERGGEEQINSLIALATSPAVVQEMLLEKDPSAAQAVVPEPGFFGRLLATPGRLYRSLHNVPEPSPIERRARAIARSVIITPARRSNVLEISFFGGHPEWVAKFLNDLVDKAIAKYTSLYETTRAQQFYREQRDLLASRVDSAQEALNAFREKVGAELLTLNRDQLRERIASLEQGRAATHTEIAELNARLDASPETIFSDATSADSASGIVVNPAVSAIKARLVELEITRSELISRYAPQSAMITDINRQIAEARRILGQERANTVELYKKEASARIASAEARLEAIAQQLIEYRDQLARFEAIAPEWERLQTELDTHRAAYMTYLRKEEEARVSNALDESQILNVTVAQPASVPRDPEPSPLLKLLAIGGGLGLFLGVGLALLRDWVDPSVKTTSQAERLTGIPVLGEVAL
jgi:uncharacterized protein involved in exopolysaccharide biosynthesis